MKGQNTCTGKGENPFSLPHLYAGLLPATARTARSNQERERERERERGREREREEEGEREEESTFTNKR